MLSRYGITWDQETGTGWYEVPAPFPGMCFHHISVSKSSVWAVNRQHEVWFRKGLDNSALGSGWTSMVGEMNLIFTGSEDQVCALSTLDQRLYLRMGIKPGESGGRTWKTFKGLEGTFISWITFDSKNVLLQLEDTSNDANDQAWRQDILGKLRIRRELTHQQFCQYPSAINSSDWIKSGRALVRNQWTGLNLHFSDSPYLTVESDRLMAKEITAVRCEAERCLVIHSLMQPPLRLTFPTEEEVEDWASHLTKICWTTRDNCGRFLSSAWALSNIGDAFVHESKVSVYNCEKYLMSQTLTKSPNLNAG